MAWGPKYSHNIYNFSPVYILQNLGFSANSPNYAILLERVKELMESEVLITAKELHALLETEYRHDISDIEEYTAIGKYWMVLQSSLANPGHVGVFWDGGVIQAKFVDTNILGGLKELQEIQLEAYPHANGNLMAWKRLYDAWIAGTDNRVLLTLYRRLEIMQSIGSAPFAELIETGNDMYPAYPTHPARGTLTRFKPVYRNKMLEAYSRVYRAVEKLVATFPAAKALLPSTVEDGNVFRRGLQWKSKSGNIIFATAGSFKIVNGLATGSGYILNPSGKILKSWSGWLPR